MRQKQRTDENIVALIRTLKKASWDNKVPFWRDIAKRLEKPRRVWAEVNVGHIERYCNKGEYAVVPGKVLGAGELAKKVNVAAVSFSVSAREKIEESGGTTMSVADMLKKNPKAKKLRIIG